MRSFDSLEEYQKLLQEMRAWMTTYMKSFYTQEKDIQQAILMKEAHTWCVTRIAKALALHLELSAKDVALAEVMGLFHDVGRFRQFTLYQTFNDADSEDHADLGLKVLADLPLMKKLPPVDAEAVRFAIGRHNKKEIGPAKTPRMLLFAKLLRDADKLDIYRVLRPFLASPDGQGVSADFLTSFCNGEQVDYRRIRTQDDRKLVRLMWAYDVNYAWTLRKIMEKNYLQDIVQHLPSEEKIQAGAAKLFAYVQNKIAQEDPKGIPQA